MPLPPRPTPEAPCAIELPDFPDLAEREPVVAAVLAIPAREIGDPDCEATLDLLVPAASGRPGADFVVLADAMAGDDWVLPPALPAEAVPVEVVPVEAVPVEAVPVEAVPVEAVPVEAVPVEAVPVEAVPVEAVPVEAVPVEVVPVEAVPVEAVPVEAVPVEAVSVVAVPVEEDAVEAVLLVADEFPEESSDPEEDATLSEEGEEEEESLELDEDESPPLFPPLFPPAPAIPPEELAVGSFELFCTSDCSAWLG